MFCSFLLIILGHLRKNLVGHSIFKDVVHLVKSALLWCCLAVLFNNFMLLGQDSETQSFCSQRKRPKMAISNIMNIIILNTSRTISLMMYQRILTTPRKQRDRNANTANFKDCAVYLMFIAVIILCVQILQFYQFCCTISYEVPSCPYFVFSL